MTHRKEEFANDEIYHVTLRALDNNLLFKDIDDYYRGIFSIYEFNNINPVTIQARRKARKAFKKSDRHRMSIQLPEFIDDREKIVEILAFCFMPNHIHLLIRQIKDCGISKFMQKLGIGLGKYFNAKNKRKGHVFQDSFSAAHIDNDSQLMATTSYIFTNPIALIEPGWKESGIRNYSTKEVAEFLENYKWSSYQDCIGIKNFPSVTEIKFILETMGGVEGLKAIVKDWVEHKKDIAKHADLFLE